MTKEALLNSKEFKSLEPESDIILQTETAGGDTIIASIDSIRVTHVDNGEGLKVPRLVVMNTKIPQKL